MIHWYVVANQRSSRIFSRVDFQKSLRLIGERVNPLSGIETSELIRHPAGLSVKSRGAGTARHITTRKHDIRQEVLDQFAKQIAEDVNKAAKKMRFDSLTLITEPKMRGSLKKNLNKDSRQSLKESISRDLENASITELKTFILKESDNL